MSHLCLTSEEQEACWVQHNLAIKSSSLQASNGSHNLDCGRQAAMRCCDQELDLCEADVQGLQSRLTLPRRVQFLDRFHISWAGCSEPLERGPAHVWPPAGSAPRQSSCPELA